MTFDSQASRAIARLMCETTSDIFWSSYRTQLRHTRPKAQLECRAGVGRATYHRYDHRNQYHLIIYGARMVMAKQSPETAASWLSTREIRKRGYFDGQVSALNLLAHTCTHEFAHLLQQHAGKRYHGSVHNHHFYQLLDQLNREGLATRARHHLAELARREGLPLDDQPMTMPRQQDQAGQWEQGTLVRFGEGPATREGRILRVNRKTCTVEGTGASRGLRFRVPFVMLQPLDS